jgi:hypothetical protein
MLPPNLDCALATAPVANNSVSPNVAAHRFLVNVRIMFSSSAERLAALAALITRARSVPHDFKDLQIRNARFKRGLRFDDGRLPARILTDFVWWETQWFGAECDLITKRRQA